MSDFISNQVQQRSRSRKTTTSSMENMAVQHPSEERTDNLLSVALLFDEEYYLECNPDVAVMGISPLQHFFDTGFREGRWPNPYFDPMWYLEQNPDLRITGVQPLLHYVRVGERDNCAPCPWFDIGWYREQYELRKDEVALLHFLQRRNLYRFSPTPYFDVEYYIEYNPDVLTAGIDPFLHFLHTGCYEGRNPSRNFDVHFYVKRYLKGELSENPFLHYLSHRNEAGVWSRMPENEATIPREVKYFTSPGPDFERLQELPASAARRAKVLAYYLPQFHPIPQNDTWWGTGFTEWMNVARGLPRFKGHYQPRVPRDLGFYSLDSNDTLRRQASMAVSSGIYGFLFYYYWFNGKRLLDKPINQFLADRSIDINFALVWANENWTRRWDGHDNEILISQDYREDDEEKLLADFARHFTDPRYIRLQQRPLLVVYRPRLIPEAAETFVRWRRLWSDRYGENPIIIMAQGFGDVDPTAFGLDGAIEFPPHKITEGMKGIENEIELLDPEFSGRVLRYDDVMRVSLDAVQPTGFPQIRTAVPGWDNDARQQGKGTVITGSTPKKYQEWLSRLISNAVQHPFFGERFVCVNAWNEWAEGAYLEPDQHYGAAYLNATGRAVAGLDREHPFHLLLVGHDAHPHGAQELLLSIGRTLRRRFGIEFEYLLLNGGALVSRYEAIAKTTVITDQLALVSYVAAARNRGISSAIVNTTAAARMVKILTQAHIDCVLLVHELPRLIREKKLSADAKTAMKFARRVVFPAASVRDDVLRTIAAPAADNVIVQPQGVYKLIDFSSDGAARIRYELGVVGSASLVLGVGYADLRKGFDLFIQLWRSLREQDDTVHLAWVGRLDPSLEAWLQGEIEDAAATGTFHVVGFTENIGDYFSAADAFALTSREDPFPAVVLEGLSAGIPAVAFERSGGIPDMLREYDVGVGVPYGDVTAMATSLRLMLQRGPITLADRAMRRDVIDKHFRWDTYIRRLLDFAFPSIANVSVALPNYNYAQYLSKRLGSIFGQTHPIQEILVLDDCSTDDSVNVIRNVAADWNREIEPIFNQQNSGSVFAQWRKAAERAEGEFLWIAEADDDTDPNFLTRLCAPLVANPAVCFAFSDSRTIDTNGLPIGDSYKPYYATVEPVALAQTEIFEGAHFVERFLSVKNLILNVSAVVWRRESLLRALRRCEEDLLTFRMAGDWRLYLEVLLEPGAHIAYEAEPLNIHRRHHQSVTHALDSHQHVREIAHIHSFACDAFSLSDAICDNQKRYRVEVATQLGVGAETIELPASQATASGTSTARRKNGRKTPGTEAPPAL